MSMKKPTTSKTRWIMAKILACFQRPTQKKERCSSFMFNRSIKRGVVERTRAEEKPTGESNQGVWNPREKSAHTSLLVRSRVTPSTRVYAHTWLHLSLASFYPRYHCKHIHLEQKNEHASSFFTSFRFSRCFVFEKYFTRFQFHLYSMKNAHRHRSIFADRRFLVSRK